jgi:hypothetical protein
MPTDAWAAPSVERMRNWRWRIMGWAVDSTSALRKRDGRTAQDSLTPVPLEIALSFYIPGDTAQVTEYRMFHSCKVRQGGRGEVWWVSRLLTATKSDWRQVHTKSGVGLAGCN